MYMITGQYAEAEVFATTLDPKAHGQIQDLCNMPYMQGSRVQIMPDAHGGMGCTIGTTFTFAEKVCPNLIGVDIGCGVLMGKLNIAQCDLHALDTFIRRNIPHGFGIHDETNTAYDISFIEDLHSRESIDFARAYCSLGTLGGGNHFIEMGKSSNDDALHVTIHSGSRALGQQIAIYHQNIAKKTCDESIPEALRCVSGDDARCYLEDVALAQRFAHLNRLDMLHKIAEFLHADIVEHIESVHNYIEQREGYCIGRKGAIACYPGERVVIPMNMQFGSVTGVGKQRPDMGTCSAPHGAGRKYSRTAAKEQLSLREFQQDMQNVFSTCVCKRTLDECPRAYKDPQEIMAFLDEFMNVTEIIKPVYNFKA